MSSLNKFFLLLLVFLISPMVLAKEAVPMSMDPALEKKVNKITSELRCLVCQNQTIADSHAELAIDLKNQVREMVKKGQTQDQIDDYMVQRYGDFVLYRPAFKTTTMLLWAGPFLFLLAGLTMLVINLRKRSATVKDEEDLSPEENNRLKKLLESDSENQDSAKKMDGVDKS